jgi:predicted ATPase
MRILSLDLSHYKNFPKSRVEIKNFDTIVGVNSSGKSNLVGTFDLLENFFKYGLEEAVALSGGLATFSNAATTPTNAPRKTNIIYRLSLDDDFLWSNRYLAPGTDKPGVMTAGECQVDFEVEKNNFDENLKPEDWEATYKATLTFTINVKPPEGESQTADAILEITQKNSKTQLKISSKIHPDTAEILDAEKLLDEVFPFYDYYKSRQKAKKTKSRINDKSLAQIFLNNLNINLSRSKGCIVYNFDPKVIKKPVKISLQENLTDNGENLAAVILYRRKSDYDFFQKNYVLTIRSFFPQIKDIDVQNTIDNNLIITFEDETLHRKLAPNSVSEGILFISLIVAAVEFSSNHIIVIEEPERYIHPALLGKLINYLKESSEKRQVLVTTHSPLVVESAGIDNLLVVEKDAASGASDVRRGNSKNISKATIDDIGLSHLFVNKQI